MIFGRVLKGKSVVRAIENNPTGTNDKPIKKVTIVDCGELKEGEDDGVPVPADGDTYEDWPGIISSNFEFYYYCYCYCSLTKV